MSVKNRVFAAAFAVSLLAGTASFAVAEPRQSRRVAIEEGQGFVAQLVERLRELVAGRRDAGEATPPAQVNPWQKDGSHTDPNGCTVNCPK